MGTTTRRDVAEAVASSAITVAWYALPDAVSSRRARAGIKAALLAPLLGIGVVQLQRAKESIPAPPEPSTDPDDDTVRRIRALTSTAPVLGPSAAGPNAGDGAVPGVGRRAVVVAAGVLLLTAVTAGTVAAERGIHHLGRRMAARGVRWPHTRIGIVAGLVMAATSLGSARLVPPGNDAR